MTFERQRALGGGVPLTEKNTTPKPTGYGKPLPRLSGSTAINGFPSLRTDDRPYSAGASGASNENASTPIKGIISPNITPRSGSRKARAETASPNPYATPNGTPTTERRAMNSLDHRASNGPGVHIPASGRTSRSESLISDGHGSSYPHRPARLERNNSAYSSIGITSPKGPAMFFHANDVQATVASKQPTDDRSPQLSIQERPDSTESRIQGWMSAASNEGLPQDQTSKFFYANDPVQSKSPPPRPSSGTTSIRPPLQTIYSAHVPTSPQRAPSPLKEELISPVSRKTSISKASPRRHTRLVSNGGSEIKAPEAIKSDMSRRSSVTSRTGGRTSKSRVRSPSVQSAGGSPSKRNSRVQLESSPSEPTKRESVAEANGVPLPSFSQDPASSFSPGVPQSPTKTQSKLDQMNELAANARRERKVLDLEISNSSLLAINRTLEREMRKQNLELRRYRRLSRSGRLSVAPTSHPGRSTRFSRNSEAAIDSDEMLSSTGSEDEDRDDDLSAPSSESKASNSPTTRAARARFQDPEAPLLDLSAHKLILLESQQMNQSIKRCLNHTDTLIAIGRRALEHQTHETEPENLGPKVLTPDEYNDDSIEQSQGLLSPGLGHRASNINPWERSLAQIGGLDFALETPDYTKCGEGNEPELPTYRAEDDTQNDNPTGMTIGDGAWAGEARTPSPNRQNETSDAVEAVADVSDTTTSTPHSSGAQDEDVSFQASLDGLDSSHVSPSPAPVLEPAEADLEDSRPPSPSRPPPTTNAAANTPGNRSSIQNFGTYLGLQSLNIFGQTHG